MPPHLRPYPGPGAPARFATAPLVRRFDPLFERYRGGLPIEYVRAIVERESDGDPSAETGSAFGLMQIVPVVLNDYNKRHGSTYRRLDLAVPDINVAIGCELLRLIVESYRIHHPNVANLQPNWANPRFVELVTLGWVAGYSEAAGVGRVVRSLEQMGTYDITIDHVFSRARAAGAVQHLWNPAKITWTKSVVALYVRERVLAGYAAPSSSQGT